MGRWRTYGHSLYSQELLNMSSVYISNGFLIKNRTEKIINMAEIRAMINKYEDIFIELNDHIYIFTTNSKVETIKNLPCYKLFARYLVFYTEERIQVCPPHVVILMMQTLAEFLLCDLINKQPLELEDYKKIADHIYIDRIKEAYGTASSYTVIKHDNSEFTI